MRRTKSYLVNTTTSMHSGEIRVLFSSERVGILDETPCRDDCVVLFDMVLFFFHKK